MSNLFAHEQILVKVNANVDKKIAPVIKALSSIDGLMTLSSCQALYPQEASILFEYMPNPAEPDLTNWKVMGDLCFKISSAIRIVAPDSGCFVSLEWRGNNDQPFGKLSFDPEQTNDITSAVRSLSVPIRHS